MQIPRLRNILILSNTLSYSSSSSSQYASFHSTTISLAKWKSKWNSDAGSGSQPSKNYIRYQVRQKRADAKKALKDLLCKRLPFQVVNPRMNTHHTSNWNAEEADYRDGFYKQPQSKNSSRKATARNSSRSRKGKPRKGSFCDDFGEESETVFETTFGGRCYTWSFRSWEDSHFQNSSSGFEWRNQANWRSDWRSRSDSANESEGDDESCDVGSLSQRKILGLPLTGPIKMEDVKTAFRSSALKWHPDKHEGNSEAMVEEKFKLCLDAYKSLCSALTGVP